MSNNKVVKAGLGYTIGNYLLKGLNFLTIPVFSRLMSTSDYGIYNTFAAYESILFVFIGLAIHTSYKNARFRYGVPEEGAVAGKDYYTYVSATMVFLCAFLALFLTLGNGLRDWLCSLLELSPAGLNLLILFSFASAVINCYNADASIQYRYMGFLKVSAANALGNIGLSILLMCTVFSKERYMGRMVGASLPALIVAGCIIIKFLLRAKPRDTATFLKWGLNYSLPIVPHGISQVILSQFDRIMIRKMVGESQAGIYSFAFNINLIITVTSQSLDTVWNQWFYEQMNRGDKAAIRKRSAQYMIGMLILSGGIILVSPELIKILGSRDYWDAKYCVVPIVTGAFFSFLYTLPSSIEYYREKTKYIAAGTICAALVNMVLNYVCILNFGYIAAAYTTLATYVLYFLFHYALAWKIEKECLFSNAAVLGCIFGILAIMAAALVFMEAALVRWALALVLAALGIILEERWLGLLGTILKKLRSRSGRN